MSTQKHDKSTKHVGLESSNSTLITWLFRVPGVNIPYMGCLGVVEFWNVYGSSKGITSFPHFLALTVHVSTWVTPYLKNEIFSAASR